MLHSGRTGVSEQRFTTSEEEEEKEEEEEEMMTPERIRSMSQSLGNTVEALVKVTMNNRNIIIIFCLLYIVLLSLRYDIYIFANGPEHLINSVQRSMYHIPTVRYWSTTRCLGTTSLG